MKKTKRLLSLLMACMLTVGMTASTCQAAVYDQTGAWGAALAENADPSSQRIYPGDSILNVEIYTDPAAEALAANDTMDDDVTPCWTNLSGTVYTAAVTTEGQGQEAAAPVPVMDEAGVPVQAIDPETQQPITDMNGMAVYQDAAGSLIYQDGMGGLSYDPAGTPAPAGVTKCILTAQGGTLEVIDGTFAGEGLNRDYHPASRSDGVFYNYTDENQTPVQVYDMSNADAAAFNLGETATLNAKDKTQEGLAFQYWAVYTADRDNNLNAVAVEMLSDEGLGSLNAEILKQPALSVPVTDFDSRIVFRPVYAAAQPAAGEDAQTDPNAQQSADPTQSSGAETVETDPNTQQSVDPAQSSGAETVETDPNTQQSVDPAQSSGAQAVVLDPNTQQPVDPAQSGDVNGIVMDPITQQPANSEQGANVVPLETDPNSEQPANEGSIFDNANEAALQAQEEPVKTYSLRLKDASIGDVQLTDNGDGTMTAQLTENAEVTAAAANKDAENKVFDSWTVEGMEMDAALLAVNPITFSMPAAEVTLTANYREKETAPATYALNVKDASVDGVEFADNEDGTKTAQLTEGTEVTAAAANKDAENKVFDSWTIEGMEMDAALLAVNPITFSMPAAEVKLTANYKEKETTPPTETITVKNASIQGLEASDNGDGTKTATVETGTKVTVVADPAPEGQKFDQWNLTAQGEVESSSLTEPTIEVTVGASSVTAVPVYAAEEVQTVAITPTKTVSPANSGTIALTEGAEPLTAGSTYKYTITPAANYELSTFTATIGGVDVFDASIIETTKASLSGNVLTFTVPSTTAATAAINITAALTEKAATTFTLTMTNGTAKKTTEIAQGEAVEITANAAQAGYRFTKWTVTAGTGALASATSATTTYTMGAENAAITAEYEQIPYTLAVANGTGGGTYHNADQVVITANAPESGYRFSSWTLTSGAGTLASATASQTTFTMTTSDATVTANYELIPYTLNVKKGSGSGTYTKGTSVDITPNFPSSGKEFDYWEKTSGSISFDDKHSYYATVTMKASDATVTAIYKDGPNPNNNAITGLENGAEYLKSTTLSFTAVGAGMDNKDPNPGDYRYRPSSYQIGSVGGSWTASPYTTSMAINATGDYTLTVTYAKDIYDGNDWTADGTNVSKSITFHVVNALSVQTGDKSPLIPLAAAGGVALVVIIALVVILMKRKKS